MREFRASEIADYFVSKGEISRPQLDRLLYYAQGFFLAHQGERLFPEEIHADALGVLVSRLNLKDTISDSIERFPPEIVEILDAVYCLYGRLAPRKILKLIRKSPPCRSGEGEISLEGMSHYFKEIVRAGKEGHSYEGEPVWPVNSFRYQQRREISRRMEKHRDKLREIASRMPPDVDPWGDEED